MLKRSSHTSSAYCFNIVCLLSLINLWHSVIYKPIALFPYCSLAVAIKFLTILLK